MTDAVVVGSGPNGLAAGVELARAGCSVTVVEAKDTLGGGMRSAELTLPGFVHDVCSTVQTLAVASPFFRSVPLDELGVRFAHPEVPLAHPLPDGRAAILHRSVSETAAELGSDRRAYERLMGPLAEVADSLVHGFLGPLRLPRHPLAMARFGLFGLRSVRALARSRFETDEAQALLGGIGAHSMLPLTRPPTAAFALMLGLLAHAVGWPVVEGGSQVLADALASYLRSLGGEIVTDHPVASMQDVADARVVLFDVTPAQLLAIAGDDLPARYRRALGRYRYGPGIFKLDWALDAPIPWKADACRGAGTVHVCGRLPDVVRSEQQVWDGRPPDAPYVLLVQPTACDPSRAPDAKHVAWAYCHVPAGSGFDMTERIEGQIERFAPGFKDTIAARHAMSAQDVQDYNSNYVGGDINGGVQDLFQLFTRPVARPNPYSTPNPRIFICSSSTPPGGGVHGMCGWFAARAALRRL